MIEDSEVHGIVLYQDDDHKFIWLGSESKYRKGAVQTMQYLIIDHGKGVRSGRSASFFARRNGRKPFYICR